MHDVAGEGICEPPATLSREGEGRRGGDEGESWEKDRETERVRGRAALGGLMTLLVACSGPRGWQGTAGQWLPAAVLGKAGPRKWPWCAGGGDAKKHKPTTHLQAWKNSQRTSTPTRAQAQRALPGSPFQAGQSAKVIWASPQDSGAVQMHGGMPPGSSLIRTRNCEVWQWNECPYAKQQQRLENILSFRDIPCRKNGGNGRAMTISR